MLKHIFLAEVVGTFMLVLVGCGAIVVDSLFPGQIGHAGISAAFGIAVLAVIYAIGNISGAHLNPAVSIGFWLAKRLPGRQVGPYILAQCIGAIAAALLLLVIFPTAAGLGSTHPALPLLPTFLFEVVITFVLMFVILNVSTGHKETGMMAGVAVGGTVAMLALFGGPVSGASMNPARSFGPALAEWNFTDLWIYWSAPVLGAALAAPFCQWIQGSGCCVDEHV